MSSDWLYPIGALSYTGYLLQGIAMEPFVAMDGEHPAPRNLRWLPATELSHPGTLARHPTTRAEERK